MVEEIDQPPCARMEEAIAYRLRNDSAGIEQELGAFLAREVFLDDPVEAVTEGEPVAIPSSPPSCSSALHDNSAG